MIRQAYESIYMETVCIRVALLCADKKVCEQGHQRMLTVASS